MRAAGREQERALGLEADVHGRVGLDGTLSTVPSGTCENAGSEKAGNERKEGRAVTPPAMPWQTKEGQPWSHENEPDRVGG
jgi:hypothetical protein